MILRGFPESQKKKKKKNMKIFIADLRKIVIFKHFTFLHISHPNEQIFTFQVSCGQVVLIFIIILNCF